MIDLYQRSIASRPRAPRRRLVGSVANNPRARNPDAASHFVFQLAHYLRIPPFLVENPADGIEVVRFVRPRKPNLGIPFAKCLAKLTDARPQHALAENKQR